MKKQRTSVVFSYSSWRLYIDFFEYCEGMPGFEDVRARAMAHPSETSTLTLLADYGKAAWEEDIEAASANLRLLQEELSLEKQSLEQLVLAREAKQAKHEKDLRIITTDLFNYIKNNEKTLVQAKLLERRAMEMYSQLKAEGRTTAEIDRLAQSLLT